MFRHRLIAPGPVETPPHVQRALTMPQLHHRSPEAKAVVSRSRELLRVVAGLPESTGWEPLIVTASGTGAFEAILTSLVSPGSRVASLSAGKFGERWGDMARALGYDVTEERFKWGESIPPEAAARVVAPGVNALLVTHSETSTGALHDLEAIAREARSANPEILILVDAITSLAIAELCPHEWGLDAVISGSQKAVAGPPGLGLVFLSPRALETMQGFKPAAYYFDLRRELKPQPSGETAFTPAINLVVGLNASLEIIAAEIQQTGLEGYWAQKKALNDALLEAAKALGCSSFAANPSPACVTLVPPAPVTGRALWSALLKRGARAQTGQDAIKDVICRISFMGHFDRYDALGFAGLLEEALNDCGASVTRGAGVAALWEALEGR
ncbi:MAG: alanine--glyoxylate aminotransferase family protein [Pleurocapsa sp. SU_196_0]|nr:alanine--glyoxylate aminotransferase family protein [Pleurocapsa sp. SU_196_0]